MDEKNFNFDKEVGNREGDPNMETAPRARNRTVMLTPEITGQVRARLAQDLESPSATPSNSEYGMGHGEPANSGFVPVSSKARAAAGLEPRANLMDPAEMRPARPPISYGNAANDLKGGSVIWAKKTPVVGFLVSFDANPNGDIYELRGGRVIVTSETSGTGNFFVVNDESVSPMHAILRISSNGEVQVLDQLSEFGTRIKRFGSEEEIELSGEKGTLEHGDIVRFGKRSFHVCIIQVTNAG